LSEKLAIHSGPKAVTETRLPVWPVIDDEVIEAVVRVMKEDKISLATKTGIVQKFEEEFAAYHEVEHVISVNSGTAAIDSAVFAAGIGPGDEVIVAPWIPGYAVLPVVHFNAIPVFADIDPKTMTLDPKDVRRKITKQTKAIIAVHINGTPCDMDGIMAIAQEYGLVVIEDCAHGMGATYQGRKLGTIGDIGAFSLQAGKNLPGGEGGMVICRTRELLERAMLVGHHPRRMAEELTIESYRLLKETGLGWNHRVHPIAAAIARIQLKRIDDYLNARRQNADYLNRGLESIPGIKGTYTPEGCTLAYYGQLLFFCPDDFGGRVDVESYCSALQAEGIDLDTMKKSYLTHFLPIFTNKDFYGKGCPWSCPYYKGKVEYREENCPEAVRMRDRAMLITQASEPAIFLMDQYLKAFQKVADSIDLL